jgi:outer membrane protein OmpA-like peptidoglycan-associated protein
LRTIATLALAASLAAPALAQAPGGVAVDYGALDSAGVPAAPGDAAPVLLKPPLAPVVLTPPPAPKREAAVLPPHPPPRPASATQVRAPAPVPPAPAAPPEAQPAAAPAVIAPQTQVVRFAKAQTDVPADGRALLDRVADALSHNARLRLELVAHASGDPDDPVAARRVALQRAVQMRSYLIEHGVESVRMDVRALGDRDAGAGPLDRVDLVLVER